MWSSGTVTEPALGPSPVGEAAAEASIVPRRTTGPARRTAETQDAHTMGHAERR